MKSLIQQFFDIMMYYLTGLDLSPLIIITHMCVALVISLIIYLVYKLTYAGVAYVKSFNVSLVVITLLTTMVMMIIRSSVALSLGMVGALSIVRFRTAVKQPKDIAYMFWAITTGLAVGAGAYLLAIVGGVFIAAILFVFNGKRQTADLAFLLVVKGKTCDDAKLEAVLAKFTRRYKVRSRNISVDRFECMFEVNMKPNSEKAMLTELTEYGVDNCHLIAYNEDLGK